MPLTFGNVQVEKVTVQNSLDYARKDDNQIVVSLGEVPVDPVEQIQRPVAAQRKQVMAGDALRLARLRDEEQLRQNGHRLQVDGECPENLQRKKGSYGMVDVVYNVCGLGVPP